MSSETGYREARHLTHSRLTWTPSMEQWWALRLPVKEGLPESVLVAGKSLVSRSISLASPGRSAGSEGSSEDVSSFSAGHLGLTTSGSSGTTGFGWGGGW